MRICFLEDTHLHGGTQIWVTEAVRVFKSLGHETILLAPENSWVENQVKTEVHSYHGYDFRNPLNGESAWKEALGQAEVALCTVHPPRDGFHPVVHAANVISKWGLDTHLIPKTGTIVPSYLREYYLPDEGIRSSVITIADFTRRHLISEYGISEDMIDLVYQGVDLNRFKATAETLSEARSAVKLPITATPVISCTGSLEERKGHVILFEAMKSLKERFPRIHLVLAGDGPLEGHLRSYVADHGLEEHVTFAGFLNNPEWVYALSDITVLPSLYKEGLPNTLLESLAFGVPAVATNIGGISEIIIDGQTGSLVKPGDSEGIIDRITSLIVNKHVCARMGETAKQLIAEKFDKQKQFKIFLQTFEKYLRAE